MKAWAPGIIACSLFFGTGFLCMAISRRIHKPLPHRAEWETRAFEQGRTDLSCPGQMPTYVDSPEGNRFFLECIPIHRGTP